MRWVGWLVFLLLALGWLAAEMPLGSTRPNQTLGAWRRTVDGWERPDWAMLRGEVHRPPLHPLVVGLLEGLLVCIGLIGLSRTTENRRTARTPLIQARTAALTLGDAMARNDQ